MTQIEQIKAKIEQLKDFFKTEREKTTTTDKGMVDKLSFSSKIVVLEELLVFINSLPAEQQSEELEIEIERYFNDDKFFSTPLGDIARHFAKWQKAQLMKSAIGEYYIKRNKYTKENVLNGLSVTCDAIQKFKDGDKVKVIIVKEDEQ